MKKKTIKKVLNNKVNNWLESIEDKSVKEAARNSVIITGGSIASMLLDEEVNDFDIYFSNKEDAMKISEYYAPRAGIKIGIPDEFKYQSEYTIDESNRIFLNVDGGAREVNVDEDDDSKYKPIFVSNNAITLEGKIQLIFRFIGDAETIHKNYDFVHCTNYWTCVDNNLVLRVDALECLLTKRLSYIGSKYPLCSVIRTRKYISRGFTCNAGEYLKMCFQVSQLDLTDVNVLREQLVGVDIHYFNLMINSLVNKRENNEDFEITEEYIFEIIDRIFN